MKTKKNAFTLIELLAVIVILAIIALIATPIILGIIKDAKEQANERSAENYLNAINNSIAREAIKNKKINDESYIILDNGNVCLEYSNNECINELKVEIKGTLPISGIIKIEKGLVKGFELIYNEEIINENGTIKNIYQKVNDSNPGIICGEGEAEDYTQTICYIKSIEDLANFSNNTSKTNSFSGKTIEIVNNLDFNNPNSYASGKVNISLITEGFSPKGTFKGTFEGNNKTIKGLYISRPTVTGIGLFGNLDSGTIQNLTIYSATVVAKGGSGILVGSNNGGTIQNINLYNSKFESSGREVGGLVGNNLGTIKNIKADGITVIGTFLNTAGLIGYNSTEGIVDNIELNNINVVNETSRAAGLAGSNDGTIQNVKASNININANTYSGGLISTNQGTIQNIDLDNLEITGIEAIIGGVIGQNTTGLVEKIKLQNIKVTSAKSRSGALIGENTQGTIKNIIGSRIDILGLTNVGGLIGQNNSGTIQQIKLTNVYVEGNERIGGLVGDNRATDTITNSKVEANVKGLSYIGLIVGYNSTGTVNTVVAKGNIEGTGNNIGGLVGRVNSTSEISVNISGVYLSGNLTFTDNAKNNQTIGDKGSYFPIFNTLASSNITINGNVVNSTDISSVDGKTLTDMGKASQSEYEAIGFEFESTDTNECYWYFDENDELDLKIK